MTKNIVWPALLGIITAVMVGGGGFFWGSEREKSAQAEELPKIQTAAFADGACAATGQKLGTCQLEISVPGDNFGMTSERYGIVGGLVLRDNGEKQAEMTNLPEACFSGDCTVSLPEGSEEAAPAPVQSPSN